MMTEDEFLEIVEALCKRPPMYTATGSFFEVASFLEGFGSGADVRHGDCQYHSRLTPFLKWAAHKFQSGEVIIQWTDFRARFASDDEACENLPVLYREYIGK